MKKRLLCSIPIVVFLIIFSSCATSSKNTVSQISESKIIEFGIFNLEKLPRQYQGANPDGTQFIIRLPRLIESTTEIPIKPDVSFGVTYQIWGTPVGSEIETTVKVVSSSGNKALFESIKITELGRWTNSCWRINSRNPSLLGNYKVQIFHENRLLVEKRFTMFIENFQQQYSLLR